MRLDRYTADEEAEHEAQEAMRDELLLACRTSTACRSCRPCRAVIRAWDVAAEANVEARAAAYEASRWGW